MQAAENSSSQLYSRYYHAVKQVVKKRRANHIQSWRLHGIHKPLIYGGQAIYDVKFGPRWQKKTERDYDHDDSSQHSTPQKQRTPACNSHLKPNKPVSWREKKSQTNSVKKVLLFKDENISFSQKAKKFFDDLIADFSGDDAEGGAEESGNNDDVKLTCASCKKAIAKATAFPQTHDWSEQTDEKKWCQICWTEYQKEKLIPLIRARQNKKQTSKKKVNNEVATSKPCNPAKKNSKTMQVRQLGPPNVTVKVLPPLPGKTQT